MSDSTGPETVGVLLMDYGTPGALDEVADYYTHIRRGRPPSDEELADLVDRYEAIGGISPLRERSESQRLAIQERLDELAADRYIVVAGHKHVAPFIEDAVDELADAGAESVVGLVLAPHFSRGSVGSYHERAAEAAAARDVAFTRIDSWHLLPAYVDFLTRAVRDAATHLPDDHHVLFTAHSLPERILVDDPYEDELRASARAVASRLGLNPWAGWGLAWQSAGRTPEPWRGPDLAVVIEELAATGRSSGVLVCAQGFVSDHLEVLYDLDVLARSIAESHGLAFARTRSLNDDAATMAALAGLVHVTATAATATGDAPLAAGPPTAGTRDGHRDADSGGPHGPVGTVPDGGGGPDAPDAGAAGPPVAPARRALRRRPTRVVVVGAGITGLAAAHRLHREDPEVEVVVVEAAERAGGRIRTGALGDWQVDSAADAFLARVPEAVALCRELGLGDQLVSPATGSALVWARDRLLALPTGLVLGVPTDLDALAACGIVSPEGVARATEDLDRPDDRPDHVVAGGDESVGDLVRRRLGDEVFERLVAPLLGGVNAGDADELSLAAGAPQLSRAAEGGGSLVAALRRQLASGPTPGPVFHGLRDGTGTLVDALVASLGHDAVATGTAVHGLWPVEGGGYRLAYTHPTTGPGRPPSLPERGGRLDADAVVLATPAGVTARILGGHPELDEVVRGLEALRWASVAMISLVVRRDAVAHPLEGSGYLVPAADRRTVTACSFASSKWDHLGDEGRAVLRVSVGHAGDEGATLGLDDDTLVARVLEDLGRHIGLEGRPETVRIDRWADALPQYRPGHLEVATAWQDRVWAALPGVIPTGASFGGLGIPACVRQGEEAARRLLETR